MGKKEKDTWYETLLRILSILGGVICLVTCIPAMPWRYARLNGNLGPRFAVDRHMSMFQITNQNKQGVTWLTMQQKVCQKMQQFQSQSAFTQAGSALLNGAAGAIGMDGFVGGAALGCS